MEPLTTLYIGVGVLLVIGVIIGNYLLPRLLYKLVQTDKDEQEPAWSIPQYDQAMRPASHTSIFMNYNNNLNAMRHEETIDTINELANQIIAQRMLLQEIEEELPEDPRANEELSPIELELREAEEYSKLNNRKLTIADIAEELDNIKLDDIKL